MFSQPELENLICKAINLYNRHRSPEATAKLVNLTPKSVTIAFSNSFCYSCGVLDYSTKFFVETTTPSYNTF